MKSKILFIMHMPPPMHGAAQVGQYIHDSKLISETFECRFFNPSASLNVKQVGHLSLKKIMFLFTSILKIAKIVVLWKPDLIYLTPSSSGWGFYRDFLTIWLLKKKKQKIVVHFHNKVFKPFRRKWYNKLLYANFFKGIKTIFLSELLVPDFEEFLTSNQVFICPNGIPLQNIDMTKKSNDVYTFFFLSNMMEKKGVKVLLNACKILKDMKFRFRCIFVGKWADIQKKDFDRDCDSYGLKSYVYAYGAKYGREKEHFFLESDCFVFPTINHGECFPLVLLEAMSYGLPCISTNIGAIPSMLENEIDGFVVEQKDDRMLAKIMASMIDNPQKGIEIGQKGRKKFEDKYTLEIFESKICSILKECLKS